MKRYLLLAFAFLAHVILLAKSDDIRLMSFNIRRSSPSDGGEYSWISRKAPCVKAIKKEDPDLLGLQEASYEHTSYLLTELSRYQIVDRHDKAGDLEPILEANNNPILYRADKFELLNYGSFWLNDDQTMLKKGWDASMVRNATWVKLRVKKSGLILFYFNTHFDENGSVAREESAKLMAAKIKEIAGDDAIVFLGGSLSMPSEQKAMMFLNDYMRAARASAKKPDKAATYNGFGKNPKNWNDHLFFRNAEIKSFEVLDGDKYGVKYISDHYPILSDFKISSPKPKK